MRYAVCDDEVIFLDMLCEALQAHAPGAACCRFGDGRELADAYAAGDRFDAVFLDIEMPGLDGMAAAREIRRHDAEVPLLFLTSHTELAPEGYEVAAFRFLQKPVIPEKLAAALEALAQLPCRRKPLLLRDSGGEYLLSPDEILYAQSANNDVHFLTASHNRRVRMKLTAAQAMLDEASPHFFKIHRCIIVNLAHVVSYQPEGVRMDNGELLPVSRRLYEPFRLAMHAYIRNCAQ